MTLAAPTLADLPHGRLVAHGCDAIGRSLFGSALYRLTLRGRTPDRIRVALPYSWPEDREQAEAILDESILFAGRRRPMGRAPWSALQSDTAVAAHLHGFEWLMDLRAVGTRAAMQRARTLVDDWISLNRRWTSPAWRPDVLGRRLAAWLSAADFLLADDDDFQRRFLASATMQARHLARVAGRLSGTATAIAAAKGRLLAALSLGVGSVEGAIRQLCREIELQVLPDGGHVQRSPTSQLAVLRDLLDLRAALQAGDREVPLALLGAVDRMAPMLRAFRHGDGGLALFNGSKEGDRRLIDAVLARAGVKGKPLDNAPHVGFQRIAAGRTVIVIDTGRPPADPGLFAHAGTLAVEISVGRERLIVNCGSFWGDDGRWRRAMQSSDAHSTLIVEGASSSESRPSGRLRRRPSDVTAVRRESEGATWLDASHDGYRRRFGVGHRRRLYVNGSGDEVRGEDSLEGERARAFKVRFHLHPDVQASMVQDGTAVLLRTAGGAGWRFLAAGGVIALDESVYLGPTDLPRRSLQIVVSASPKEPGARVKWAIRREGAA